MGARRVHASSPAQASTIDQVKDQLKAAGVGKLVLWSAGRDLFPLAQALGEGEEIKAAVRGELDGKVGWVVATPERVLATGGGIFPSVRKRFRPSLPSL